MSLSRQPMQRSEIPPAQENSPLGFFGRASTG
jgi:hypothetical protein